MNIIIERFYGNPVATQGRLHIEGSAFTCYTLEAADPLHAQTRNKTLLALPDGTYPAKLVYGIRPCTLRFPLTGTYRAASFEEGSEPDDVAPGSVILGTHFTDPFSIGGSDRAMQAFAQFLQLTLLPQTLLNPSQSSVTVTIAHTPDFRYDKKAAPTPPPLPGLADEGWNLIADTEAHPQPLNTPQS